MEHILNGKERNLAFTKFIAFFLVTTALIVFAVYFDYRIPFKDNDQLRERLRTYESQLYNQEQFVATMETAKNLIDSSGRQAQVNVLLDQEIARHLAAMKSPAYQDSSIYSSLHKDVFNLFYDYNEMNKRLVNAKNALTQVETLSARLNEYQLKYDNAERDLEMFRRSSNAGF